MGHRAGRGHGCRPGQRSDVSSATRFVSIEPVEMTGDDRNRDGERQDAGDGARGAHQFSPVTDGHLVAVADRCHGDDRPPEGVRDAVDLRVGLPEFGVVDRAGKHQQADAEGHQEQAETFEAGAKRQHQHLESDGMFRQLEDADQSDHAQKSQRRTRLCAFAAHRRQNVEECDVVGQHGGNVDDVLEVAPERKFRRTRDKPNDRLDREPRRARRLDEEEHVEKVGHLSGDTVRHGVRRKSLHTEQDDRRTDESNRKEKNIKKPNDWLGTYPQQLCAGTYNPQRTTSPLKGDIPRTDSA